MADRRDERDLPGGGGLNNPLLDDILLSAAAAAASGSNQPNMGNIPGATVQQQQQQYQGWGSSYDHLNLPSAYSGWYGQPGGMGFSSGADLLCGSFPNYDDLLAATVNQGASGGVSVGGGSENPLLRNQSSYNTDSVPFTSAPNASMPGGGGAFLASQHQMGMGYSNPDHQASNMPGNSFQIGGAPGDGGLPFQQASSDGRNMYTDALNRWDMYQGSIYSPFNTEVFKEPKPIDPSPWDTPSFSQASSISHSDLIKSPPPPIPTPQDRDVLSTTDSSIPEVTEESVQNLADQILEGISAASTSSESVRSTSPSVGPSSSVASATICNRPSYSDVAKHVKAARDEGKQKEHKRAHKASSDWHGSGDTTPPLDILSVPVNIKPAQRQKQKSSRQSHKLKSEVDTSVKPDSKYGLDMFEELGREKVRGQNSESSTPLSRKSSASSITSASSGGIEDSAHQKAHNPADAQRKVNAYDGGDVVGVVGTKYDIRKGDLKNHNKFSQGTQAHVQETRAGSASPHISAQPKHKKANTESAKSNQTQPKVFFDPKRIFQSQSSSSGKSASSSAKASSTAAEKSSIPNNQQPSAGNRREQPEVLLNNGKPTSSLFSGGNVGKPSNTTYINNDLRQHKKQTNTEERNSPHRSTTESFNEEPRRGGAGVRHRQEHAHSSQTAAPNQNTDAPTSHSQGGTRSSSAGRRKRPETSAAPSARKTPVTPEDRPPRRPRKNKEHGPTPISIIYEWLWSAWLWIRWSVVELWEVVWSVAVILFKLCVILVLVIVRYVLVLCGKVWSFLQLKIPFVRRFAPRSSGSESNIRRFGLEENITLPATGDEAMRRLLACKGKDPYSILGVRYDASDDDIKKYYRKQAVLVHPDKNQQPGAEESFKILGAAFEIVGEPEKRKKFDSQRVQTHEMEEDMKQFTDLLTKLQEKVQEAANMMRCENCGGKHRRFPIDRAWYDARFCDKCNTRHSAKEGDVWAESRVLGFLWHYYACMEGKVYDITEWASCQKNHFKHMQANAHQVIYRIATNANKRGKGQGGSEELEDFLNQLFHHAARSDAPGAQAGATAGSPGAESANYSGAWDRENGSGSSWSRGASGPSPQPPPGGAAAGMAKRRKKKRKH